MLLLVCAAEAERSLKNVAVMITLDCKIPSCSWASAESLAHRIRSFAHNPASAWLASPACKSAHLCVLASLATLLIWRTGVILLFGLIAAVCRTADIAAYRSQTNAAKLIFVSHIAYFLIFAGTMVPYSIGIVKVLFAPGAPSALLEAPTYRSMLFPLTLQLAMYLFEVSNYG